MKYIKENTLNQTNSIFLTLINKHNIQYKCINSKNVLSIFQFKYLITKCILLLKNIDT